MLRALVTGGSRGIGEAIVKRLLQSGYSVHIFDILTPTFSHPHLSYEKVDLSHLGRLQQKTKKLTMRTPLSLLVNNAGIYHGQRMKCYDNLRDIDRLWRINFLAPLTLAEGVRLSPNGRVINIASVAGFIGGYDLHYAASKAALINATKSLGISGMNAFAIAPGIVQGTQIFDLIPDSVKTTYQKMFTDQPFATPEQVADTVLWVAHEAPLESRGVCYDLNRQVCRL